MNSDPSLPPTLWRGSGTLTASRIGTYGQFGLGSSFMFANTGWLGFARVDYRIGDNIESLSGTAGLRYQLNPETGGLKEGGSLKDASPASRSWTGPYVGVSAGGTAGNTPWTHGDVSVDPDYGGYLAGAQAGYNYQAGRFVLGAEGSYGLSNARGASHVPYDVMTPSPAWTNANDTFEVDLKSLGTVTGRLGYTFGPALFYAKGGWAFGQLKEGKRQIPVPGFTTGASDYEPSTIWANGWTAGGGMEFALSERWSAKAEYMHYELGKRSFDQGSIGQPELAPVDAPGATAFKSA